MLISLLSVAIGLHRAEILTRLETRVTSMGGKYRLDYLRATKPSGEPFGKIEFRSLPDGNRIETVDISDFHLVQAVPVGLDLGHRDAFLLVTQGGGGRFYRARVVVPSAKGLKWVFDQDGEGTGMSALPDLSAVRGRLVLGIGQTKGVKIAVQNYVWDSKAGRFVKS